ncbi:MAG TPA: polymer-forming cytoskeletal protein [Acidobacteriaceae bacterium]|nr:polymer-forming cytoskeletal protein [Acidobacteriaceae bacterium]
MKPSEGSTVIGKSVTIRGEVSGQEDLWMDGTIEGTITLSEGRLTIGPNAKVQADLQAHDVVIYGRVDGKVRAAGRVELRDSAALRGDILAERLSIEENATLKGRVELTESSTKSAAGAEKSAELFPAGGAASA